MGERAFIVTQSIKKLPAEDKAWALDKTGFRRVSDDKLVDITKLPDNDTGLYYKDEPYTPKNSTKDSLSRIRLNMLVIKKPYAMHKWIVPKK